METVVQVLAAFGSGFEPSTRYAWDRYHEEIPDFPAAASAPPAISTASAAATSSTSWECDGESGLNFLLACYYSMPMGRFLSIDPFTDFGRPDGPQNWNGNPLVSGNR